MTNDLKTTKEKKEKKPSKLKGFVKKRKKLSIFLLILLILVCVVGFIATQAGANPAMMTTTDPIVRENLAYRVKVSGTTSASHEQQVLSKASGTIKQILVTQGEQVKAGQALAVIDSPDLDKQIAEAKVRISMEVTRLQQSRDGLASAQANVSALESSYQLARQTYEANQSLYNEGALSKIALDTSKLEMDRARNAYEQAKKDVSGGSQSQGVNLQSDSLTLANLAHAALLEQKENLTVKSAIDGAVGEIFIKDNQTVTIGMQLFYVVDNDNIEVIANVGEYDAQKISIGAPVTIIAEGSGGEVYDTTISYISPYAKKATSSQSTQTVVEVKAVISGAGSSLKAGYSVNLDILCEQKDNILTIPYEAILTSQEGEKYVFKNDAEGKPVAYLVTLGLEGALRVELVSGDLAEGDELILNPTEEMLKAATTQSNGQKDAQND